MTTEEELIFLREQNDRLAHALRKMERENDEMEQRITRLKKGWNNERTNLLKGIHNKKTALKELGPLQGTP